MTNDELLHKWVQNTLTAEELKVFQQRPEYASLTALYKHTKKMKAPEWDGNVMLSDILSTPKKTGKSKLSTSAGAEQPKSRRFLPKLVPFAIAASMLLLVGYFSRSFLSDDGSKIDLATLNGETKKGSFPDGSTYVLSGDSRLSYSSEDWTHDRDITLEGEAYFSVEKGTASFRVHTPAGRVQVLGTQFSVASTDLELAVSCDEGIVKVVAENYEEKIAAGEYMWATSTSSKTFQKDITKLRRVTLKEVTAALTKSYGLNWDLSETDASIIMTCNFRHDNLKQALKTSLSTLDLDYQIDGSLVRFSK